MVTWTRLPYHKPLSFTHHTFTDLFRKGREEEKSGREDGWIKETLLQFSEAFFVSCTGVVLQESVQSQSSMASNEISEVRVYV